MPEVDPFVLHGIDLAGDQVADLLDRLEDTEGAVLYFHGGLSTRSYVEDELGPELLAHYLDPEELHGRMPVLVTYDALRIDLEQVRATLGKNRVVRMIGWLRRYFQGDRTDSPIEPSAFSEESERAGPEVDEGHARTIAMESLATLQGPEPLGPREGMGVLGDDFEEPGDAVLQRIQDELVRNNFQLAFYVEEVEAFLAENDPVEAERLIGPLTGARILYRILRRYGRDTDHGLIATVVEELMRGLTMGGSSLAHVAQGQWTMVHRRARRIWEPARNGAALLHGLAEFQADRRASGGDFRISLVSHSAGAIAICRMLEMADAYDLRLELDINFIVPAANFRLVSETLCDTRVQVTRLRNFLLRENYEEADRLLGPVYPRSLLYFVSGVAERDGDGDMMLIGLDRHMQPNRSPYCEPWHPPRLRGAFGDVRGVWWRFGSDRLVHCPDEHAGPGRANDGTSHENTKLPTETPTLSGSLRYLLVNAP